MSDSSTPQAEVVGEFKLTLSTSPDGVLLTNVEITGDISLVLHMVSAMLEYGPQIRQELDGTPSPPH
jgi:hypothetical protein